MEGDTNQGGGKPSPYPMTQGQAQTSRVRACPCPGTPFYRLCHSQQSVQDGLCGKLCNSTPGFRDHKSDHVLHARISLSGLLPAVRVDPPHRLTRGLFHNGRHAKTGVAASTCESCSSGCAFSPSFFCTVGSRALEYEYMRAKRRAVVMRAIHYEGDF